MLVILFGLPGVGKSTAGKAVAKELGWQFLDIDDATPLDFKDRQRKGEAVPIEEIRAFIPTFIEEINGLHAKGNLVVSAVFADPEVLSLIKKETGAPLLIHLQADYETLIERIRERDHFFGEELFKKVYEKVNFETDYPKVNTQRNVKEVVAECVSLIRKG